MNLKLKRYAQRTGKTVEWGNMVGPYLGQAFRETFKTEKECTKRERQALACEAISVDREPIAKKREVLRP